MPALLFTACLSVAFGPAAAFLAVVVARSAHLLVLGVVAAFAELLGFLATSLVWFVTPSTLDPGRIAVTVGVGSLLQEMARGALVVGVGRVERGLERAAQLDRLPFPEFGSALASGFGFGLMYALLKYGSVLGSALGPGDLFSDACPGTSLFVVSAFAALAMQVLHVALMVCAFDATRRPSLSPAARGARWIAVLALHLAASSATLANDNASVGGCALGTPLLYVVVGVACLWAMRVALSSEYGDVSGRRRE